MTAEQVSRYIDLVHRRMQIIFHSGTDWKPEYTEEIQRIDKELAELRPLIEQEHEKRLKKSPNVGASGEVRKDNKKLSQPYYKA